MRWVGEPCGETVARVMAFGSWMPAWVAWENHFSKKWMGEWSRSLRWRPREEYSFLKSDRSMGGRIEEDGGFPTPKAGVLRFM